MAAGRLNFLLGVIFTFYQGSSSCACPPVHGPSARRVGGAKWKRENHVLTSAGSLPSVFEARVTIRPRVLGRGSSLVPQERGYEVVAQAAERGQI